MLLQKKTEIIIVFNYFHPIENAENGKLCQTGCYKKDTVRVTNSDLPT